MVLKQIWTFYDWIMITMQSLVEWLFLLKSKYNNVWETGQVLYWKILAINSILIKVIKIILSLSSNPLAFTT